MRNLKKVLALVIAFSMMLSVVAFAGYADVDADADYASAVELTSALGIFQGDGNGFNPDKTITRAEMAAVIIRMQGLESAAKANAGATDFSDVAADHWASGYVNLASDNGIIKGVGEGKFAPNDELTYEMALAMIVRALGFEPVAERKGGWTAGYVAVANTYKVTEGADATATRGNLAILVANAMNTPMMDQTSYGSDEKYEVLDGKNQRDYRTLLTDMDVYVATGVVGEKDADKVDFVIEEDSDCGTFDSSKDKKEESFVIGESNIMDYQYQQVDAYVLKDGRNYVVLAAVPSNIGETFEILSDDLKAYDSTKGVLEYYVDAANSNKTKELKVAADIDKNIVYNKGAADITLAEIVNDDANNDIELTFIENTGDTTFDKIIATKYISDVVTYSDVERDKLALKQNSTITFDFEDEDATIILADDAGAEITLEDLAEGDVVAIVADSAKPAKYQKYIQIIKLANASVEGVVDETYESNDVNYIVVNGEEYPMAIDDNIAAGDEGIFYIGLTGKVIYFDGSLAGENYAYILEGAIANGAFTNDQWQVKLLTKDGVETFDVRKNYHPTVKAYIEANFDAQMNDAKDKFIFDDGRADHEDTARLVTFKLDGNGEIKYLAPVADAKITSFDMADAKGEYRGDAQILGGANLEDDITIFNVAGKYAKDAYVTDISFLVDEAKYTGFVASNADDEFDILVISELQSVFSEDTGFAVVTKISTGKDAEGEEVTKVTYVQNEEEGVISIDDDATLKNAQVQVGDQFKDLELAIGDAFMFVADAKGNVSEYVIIAKMEGAEGSKKFKLTADVDTDAEVIELLGEDTSLVVGYIENDRYISSNKGEKITVNGAVYVVPGSAYKYTYNEVGRNVAIEVSDFMADADYAGQDKINSNDETVYASPVLLRVVNKVVVDAYGATARIAQIGK